MFWLLPCSSASSSASASSTACPLTLFVLVSRCCLSTFRAWLILSTAWPTSFGSAATACRLMRVANRHAELLVAIESCSDDFDSGWSKSEKRWVEGNVKSERCGWSAMLTGRRRDLQCQLSRWLESWLRFD